jgi:hypothetical protein
MKAKLLIIILILIAKSSFGQQFTDLYGDYLGQTLPSDTPVVFAHGIVSTKYMQHGFPAFSPDCNEVFWQENQRGSNNEWLASGMTMQRIGDRWTEPSATPYRGSVFSTDGKRLFFELKESKDLYFIEKQGGSWSEPKCVGLLARFPELKFVYQPSITRNGTLYFIGYVEEKQRNVGIYQSAFINGAYSKPELLPPNINVPREDVLDWTPYIAPDESCLIFCSNRGLSRYDQDIFICFQLPDGSWTNPVNMGKQINTTRGERFPAISPDGKFLFFTRDDPDDFDKEDVFWVNANIIDELREKSMKKK